MSQAEDQHQAFQISDQCTAGQLLQIARHAQQLSHADVANKLRISEQYVKDLEVDDFTHIGARIYVRGYLLSYAKLLGIPQQDMLQAMQVSFIPEESMSMQRMLEREKPTINISLRPRGHYKRHFTRWFGVVIGVVLVAMIVVWWQSQKKQVYSTAELDNITHTSTATSAQPVQQNVPLESPKITTTPAKPADLTLIPNNQTDKHTAELTTTVTPAPPQTTTQPVAVDTAIDATDQPQTLPSNAVRNPVITNDQTATTATPGQNPLVNTTSANPGAINNNAATTAQQPGSQQSAQSQATQPSAVKSASPTKTKVTRHSKSKKRPHHSYKTSAQNLRASLPEPGAT